MCDQCMLLSLKLCIMSIADKPNRLLIDVPLLLTADFRVVSKYSVGNQLKDGYLYIFRATISCASFVRGYRSISRPDMM